MRKTDGAQKGSQKHPQVAWCFWNHSIASVHKINDIQMYASDCFQLSFG